MLPQEHEDPDPQKAAEDEVAPGVKLFAEFPANLIVIAHRRA